MRKLTANADVKDSQMSKIIIIKIINRPEYREESWRLEKTSHSNSTEKPSANASVKNSQKRTNNNNNNNNNNDNNSLGLEVRTDRLIQARRPD